jgi:hypothetical protein
MSDLERVTQAQASSALTEQDASLRRSLSDEDLSILLAEMDSLARRYPSQDQEESIESYMTDFEQLALKYSLRKVQQALQALRIRAGQKFFPRPDEVAQEIEDQREARLREAQRMMARYGSGSGMSTLSASMPNGRKPMDRKQA